MTSNLCNKSVESSRHYFQRVIPLLTNLVLTHRVLGGELAVVSLRQAAGEEGEEGGQVDGGDHGEGDGGDGCVRNCLGMMLVFLSHLSRNCHTLAPSLLLLNTAKYQRHNVSSLSHLSISPGFMQTQFTIEILYCSVLLMNSEETPEPIGNIRVVSSCGV